jgi:NAD(P)-dependent dehydrogenase (short-subunit alcohol dehydrogenase family)
MIPLNIIRAHNAAIVKSTPLVAVCIGGTDGIGECAVRALATTHGTTGKGLRVYIVGRNEAKADKIRAECSEACPPGQFKFVKANDLSLIKDVDRVCAEIVEAEKDAAAKAGQVAKVDLLVLTQGALTLSSRKGRDIPKHFACFEHANGMADTEEGLGSQPAVVYYGRMRCIVQLLPLLTASPLGGRVASVLAPGNEGKLFPEDLSLRDPKKWSLTTSASHACYMATFFMEELAKRNAGKLSLAHIYPGLVMTDLVHKSEFPGWVGFAWNYGIAPWAKFFAVPKVETGERLMFYTSPRFPPRPAGSEKHEKAVGDVQVATSTDGVLGGGCYAVNWKGDTYTMKKTYPRLRKDGMSEKVWNHTMEAFKVIEGGGVFSD